MNKKSIYNVKPTARQKRAIDNILSGGFKTIASAMREAGYSIRSSHNPKHILANRRGVQNYIQSLPNTARKRWGITLQEKVLDVYLDGLDAIKLHGKEGNEHPDYIIRLDYANKISEFIGWLQPRHFSRKLTSIHNFFEANQL